ncbi:MAG: hypothetical protein A07HR67_00202 [uncultured archaeon A07HR67]|nr:MAG: hypothetical protein A07HR67_00202 [uncultured archaeon A07HR67]
MMAESTADLVCDRLGVDEPCQTADETLPAVDAPERLDEAVARFDGQGDTDADVVDAGSAGATDAGAAGASD